MVYCSWLTCFPVSKIIYYNFIYEPPHDKTNKVSVHTVKTQISLGIRPVWCPGWPESLLSAWRKPGSLAPIKRTVKTLIRLGRCPGWSESSLGAHLFCWFCHVVAHMHLNPSKAIFSSYVSQWPLNMKYNLCTSYLYPLLLSPATDPLPPPPPLSRCKDQLHRLICRFTDQMT